ncbi:unnamed protein product [Sphagnum jensenii]|uniref:Uncharacterized protein n=1 Tax=Sphagnum jensenii TaxID=128206 RepID=A0ABP0W5K8_9BRYO
MAKVPPWSSSWEDLDVCQGRSWAHGELSAMAEVPPQPGPWEKYGRFPRSFKGQLVGSFPKWPRCLPGWARQELSAMAKFTPRPGSQGILNNG